MTDLIAFLRARLDEDERAAQRAGASCWHECDDGDLEFHDRFDPDRVLREVEAKRRLLVEHPILTAWRVCTRCSDYAEPGEIFREVSGPCATVRLLALPYADHDDYREEWKP